MTKPPKDKVLRRKIGAGGPEHWKSIRHNQKSETRDRIRSVIGTINGFPTRAAVVKAGKGKFGDSSVDRHIDLIDEAQVAANKELIAAGQPPQPLRKSDRRAERNDQRLEEERARSADLAARLKACEAQGKKKDTRILELEERVRRLELAEVQRRRASPAAQKKSED